MNGLQWGHTPKGVDTGRSMWGPCQVHWLQWGHTPKGVDTSSGTRLPRPSRSCFNGATPRKVWIRDHRQDHPGRVRRLQWGHTPKGVDTGLSGGLDVGPGGASMGPHPERCGYYPIPSPAHPGGCASMGPHPERCGYRGSVSPPVHAFNSFNGATPRKVWIPAGAAAVTGVFIASMGPHPERCGYFFASTRYLPSQAELQWGHTPKGVDTDSRGCHRGHPRWSFNGATPRKVWIRLW